MERRLDCSVTRRKQMKVILLLRKEKCNPTITFFPQTKKFSRVAEHVYCLTRALKIHLSCYAWITLRLALFSISWRCVFLYLPQRSSLCCKFKWGAQDWSNTKQSKWTYSTSVIKQQLWLLKEREKRKCHSHSFFVCGFCFFRSWHGDRVKQTERIVQWKANTRYFWTLEG